ncbi:MAG TPA: carboxypeptidase-like regulatory domain-containing protein, partial [Rhodothermales bacterium]|nr:carboxypeptidase-like regulatory domain-containing protein [Rhodothermales bacterium]
MKKLVGLVFLLTPFVAMAQSGKVAGNVTDASSGAPLPGATVRLEPTRLGTATDNAGRYVVSRVPDGEYTLSVTFIGYRNFKRAVTVRNGGEMVVNVSLQEDPTGLDEVVV